MGKKKKTTLLVMTPVEYFLTITLPDMTDKDRVIWEPILGGMFNSYSLKVLSDDGELCIDFEYLQDDKQDDKPTVYLRNGETFVTFKGYQYRAILDAIRRQVKRIEKQNDPKVDSKKIEEDRREQKELSYERIQNEEKVLDFVISFMKAFGPKKNRE